MKVWKLLGLAGVAGVAATGVIVVRAERRRQAYTPEEIRARLHERFTDLPVTALGQASVTALRAAPADVPVATSRSERLRMALRRR